jgi:prophage endopeptidase
MTPIILRILPYLAALLIGAGGAWVWQANSYGAIIAIHEASRQADLAKIANAGAAQALQAIEKQQVAEQVAADLDKKHQKEKTDGLAKNELLRRTAADSARRLRIAGSCLASGRGVSDPASAAGLGDAGTIELSAGSGSTVFDIRAGIIADNAALRALQIYVRDVCLRQFRDAPR